jgi:hypothetical protein
MPDVSPFSSSKPAARLLKGAAVLFAVLGASFVVWVGDQWIDFPEARATQFGFEAPLWPALGGFVLLAIVAVAALFWTAARRVERGEDLFARRHRRRSDPPERTNGTSSE